MEIKDPCIITPRLLPGVKIADAFISIEYDDWTPDGRMGYRYYIDAPDFEHSDNDLSSGVGGGTLREGLESLLSFLGACAESIQWAERHGKEEGENSDLFPANVGEWAVDNSDEISMMQCMVEETTDCIREDKY